MEISIKKGYQLLIMLDMLSQKRCKVTSRKLCSHSTRRLEEKDQLGAMAMAQCVAASFALTALPGLSPQLLSAQQ